MTDYVLIIDTPSSQAFPDREEIDKAIANELAEGAELESIECERYYVLLWFSKEDEIPLDEIDWSTIPLVELIKMFLDNNGNPFKLMGGEYRYTKDIIDFLKEEANK